VNTEATKVVIVKIMVETLGIFGMAMTASGGGNLGEGESNPDAQSRDHR
jgi:F0F1-type ATP synthase membrane subunit c/vacuolar-type H+-ATPase subunit K